MGSKTILKIVTMTFLLLYFVSVCIDLYFIKNDYGINIFLYGKTYNVSGKSYYGLNFSGTFSDQFELAREICFNFRMHKGYIESMPHMKFDSCSLIDQQIANPGVYFKITSLIISLFSVIHPGL